MKDKIKQIAYFVLFFLLGITIGVLIFLAIYPENLINIAITVAACAAMTFSVLMIIVIQDFIVPHVERKRAALRALGKDGMRVLRHDKTARLAYKGIYALIKGDYPEAEDKLQQALANSDVRQNQKFCVEWLIKLYEATEDNGKIMWCFRKAAEYSPDDAEALSRLGHAYFSEGNLDKAEYYFEHALQYDANNGYSYYNLVKIYLVREEYEKAREMLEQLMKINENHPLAHAEYANYYAMLGDRENALEQCKKAQLCGYKDPEELNRRINAMLSFEETKFSGEDLPSLYYRRIENIDDK